MRSQKIILMAMSLAALLMGSSVVFAQTTAPAAPPMGGHMGSDPAMHAAFESCRGSVAKDAQGHPDHTAMQACLKSKGFSPPPPPPGGMTPPPIGAGAPPPPSGAMMAAPPTAPVKTQ